MKLLCAFVIGLLATPHFAQAELEFDPLLATENLWSLGKDEFQRTAAQLPFSWTSTTRDSARAARKGMTLFGLPVYEVVARFDEEKLKEMTIAFYARGDAGEVTEPKFEQMVETSSNAVSKFANVKPVERGKDATNAVRAKGTVWQTPKATYVLEHSATREVKSQDIPFRAEFIRLEVTPPEKKVGLLQQQAALSANARSKFNGQAHVKRDATSGDVWLVDVPMVDQGQKGYCVVASAERVMRYYGKPVDANELAQLANTETDGGTDPRAMNAALKRIAARLKVRVRPIQELEVRDVLEMIKDYNRAAKRAKAPEIPDPGNYIDLGRILSAMNYEVLKDARLKSKSELGRFQRTVQAHIEAGIPLLWTVRLGLFEEKGIPQDAGGHMRLIIGYNSTKQEILFSDSWGARHELKRMPLLDAWTITMGLTTIEPI